MPNGTLSRRSDNTYAKRGDRNRSGREKSKYKAGESKEIFYMDNCTGERKTPDFLRTITSEFQTIPILGNQKCYYVPLIRMVRTELSKPLKPSPTTLQPTQ